MVCGLWFAVCGLWLLVFGLWFAACGLFGFWFMVFGLRLVVFCCCVLVCGVWFLAGFWFLVSGFWLVACFDACSLRLALLLFGCRFLVVRVSLEVLCIQLADFVLCGEHRFKFCVLDAYDLVYF